MKVFYIADYQFERDTSLPLDPDEQYEHDMLLPLGFNGQFEHDTAVLSDPEDQAKNVTHVDHIMTKHGTQARCHSFIENLDPCLPSRQPHWMGTTYDFFRGTARPYQPGL